MLKFKKIKLVGWHKDRDPNEIKGKIYCKWHDAFTHKTGDCIIFRNRIQDEIDKGNIDFPDKSANACEVESDFLSEFEKYEMDCNMISIDADILSYINMQELSSVAIAVKLYNRIVEEGVLIAPKCQEQDYDDLNMCRWHFSALTQ